MSSPEYFLPACTAAVRLAAWSARHCARAALAGQEGLEPPTAGFGDRNSSQLSYCPVTARAGMHGPLADDHQLQKCTWPAARRRTAQLKSRMPALRLTRFARGTAADRTQFRERRNGA